MVEDFGKRIDRVVGEAFGDKPSKLVFEGRCPADERLPSAAGRQRQQLKIAVGSDHRGLALKRRLAEYLGELGHLVVDCGITEDAGGDYPDVALKVAEHVVRQTCDFGVLIDMIGVGSAIAANKIAGIRAAPCYDVNAAVSSRSHNFARRWSNLHNLSPGGWQNARPSSTYRCCSSTPNRGS